MDNNEAAREVRMRNWGLILIFGLMIAAACGRYGDYSDDDGPVWTEAWVIFMGAPEVDGCGWMIQIGDEYFYPVNLEDEYRVEVLPVKIRYTYDPVEFRCGLKGKRFPSIRIDQIVIDAPLLLTMREREQDRILVDGFRMDSAFVNGDFLFLHVGFSGGCRTHEFNLWRLPPDSQDPPSIELMLSHDAKDDPCDAWITEWLVFSLEPLRERNKHEIKFLLRGPPAMSAYFGEYIYKY